MLSSRSLLVVLALAAVACNGRVTADDSSSTSSRSKAGDAEKSSTPDPQEAPAPTHSTPAAPTCSYEYGSSSSGGDGTKFSCESTDNYTCGTDEKSITCSCTSVNGVWSPGKCGCTGGRVQFDFDCNNGCAPGPAEYAQCNLPLPDGWGIGGDPGSSSSSSGG